MRIFNTRLVFLGAVLLATSVFARDVQKTQGSDTVSDAPGYYDAKCNKVPFIFFPNLLFFGQRDPQREITIHTYDEIDDVEHQDLRWLLTQPALAERMGELATMAGDGTGISCFPEHAIMKFRPELVDQSSVPGDLRVPSRFSYGTNFDFSLDLFCPKFGTEQEGYLDYYKFRFTGNYYYRIPESRVPVATEVEELCGVRTDLKFEFIDEEPQRFAVKSDMEKLQERLLDVFKPSTGAMVVIDPRSEAR